MSKILDAIESTTKEIEALNLKLEVLKAEFSSELKEPNLEDEVKWLESLGFVLYNEGDYYFSNMSGATFTVTIPYEDVFYWIQVHDEWDNLLFENKKITSFNELKISLMFQLNDKAHKRYSFTYTRSALSKEAFIENLHSYLDEENYDVDSVVVELDQPEKFEGNN